MLANEEFVARWTLVILDGNMDVPDMVSEVPLTYESSTNITWNLSLFYLLLAMDWIWRICCWRLQISQRTFSQISHLAFTFGPLFSSPPCERSGCDL